MRKLPVFFAITVAATVAAAMPSLASGAQQQRAPEYVPGQLLVQYKPTSSGAARVSLRSRNGLERISRLPLPRAEVVKLPAGTSPRAVARKLRRDPRVLMAGPNHILRPLGVPNDPLFGSQYQLNGSDDADIDAPQAWMVETGRRSVIAGLVDFAANRSHVDLRSPVPSDPQQGNMWVNTGETGAGRELNGLDDDGNGYVDDPYGWNAFAVPPWNGHPHPAPNFYHGTAVASVLGAIGNNGIGLTGVSHRVGIVQAAACYIVAPLGGGCPEDVLMHAIDYVARNGAKVVNLSVGLDPQNLGSDYPPSQTFVLAAIRRAPSVLFVAGAGNGDYVPQTPGGDDNDIHDFWPCTYSRTESNVICVGGTTADDELWFQSNWGKQSVNLMAAAEVVETASLNGYHAVSGTSFAAPQVTGAAALLWSYRPSASMSDVKGALLGSVDQLPSLAGKTSTGGRLNLAKALSSMGPGPAGAKLSGSRLFYSAAGDGSQSNVKVSLSSGKIKIVDSGTTLMVDQDGFNLGCSTTGKTATCPATGVESIVIDVQDGDDRVNIASNVSIPAFVMAGDGDDKIKVKGSGGNYLVGDLGDDYLHGGRGADELLGGHGNDKLVGSSGNDVIRGEYGADRVSAGSGNDLVFGFEDPVATDRISCSSGADKVQAGAGDRPSGSCETVTRVP